MQDSLCRMTEVFQAQGIISSDMHHSIPDTHHNSPSQTKSLPTLNTEPVLLKGFTSKPFGKVVRILHVSGALLNNQPAIGIRLRMEHVRPEEMPLHSKVLGASCAALVAGKEVSSLIVLEHGAVDHWLGSGWQIQELQQVSEDIANWDDGAKEPGESGILSFKRAEADFRHEHGGPGDGDTTNGDNSSKARTGRVRGALGFTSVEAGKVSISPNLHVKGAIRLDNDALVTGPLEVADDGLNRGGVALLGAVDKPSNLGHSVADVRASVVGKVEEHANKWKSTSTWLDHGDHQRDQHQEQTVLQATSWGCSLSSWLP